MNRRHLLAALTSAVLWPAGAAAAVRQTPAVLRRWRSGNRTLAPLAWGDGHILFNGEATLGRLDPQHDTAVWQQPHGLADGAVFKPRAANDLVIAGGQKALGAWQLDTGQLRWRHSALIQVGTPCVTPQHTFVGDGHVLLALDNRTGAVAWRFAGTPDTLAAYAPVVADNTVFFGPGNGLLYALDIASGQLQWQLDDSQEWQYVRQMQVSGQVLVAGTYTELLYGIAVATGKILWRFKVGNFINSHHVVGNTAYLWSPTGWIYAIATDTGLVRWRHQTTRYGHSGSNWGPMMAELVTLADKLYCLDMNQVLHVLDRATGQELQRVAFAHDLRPTLLALPGQQAVMASDSGEVQLVQWPA